MGDVMVQTGAAGVLSQALANLETAEQHVQGLTNLPADAQKIVSDSTAVITPVVATIRQAQVEIGALIEGTLPRLDEIEALLAQGRTFDEMKEKIHITALEASSVKKSVEGVAFQLQASADQVYEFQKQLHGVEANLTAQMIALQTRVSTARSQEAAAKKKYDYLMMLGPLGGLFGMVASALTSYLGRKQEVAQYESQISALNSQTMQFKVLQMACEQLLTDFQTVTEKISGVSNTLTLLAGDITKIVEDIDEDGDAQKSSALMQIYLTAAETEIETLRVDAA